MIDWADVRERLAFLTSWIPDGYRELLDPEAWWLILFVGLLLVLLTLAAGLRRVVRGLRWIFWGAWQRPVDWDAGYSEDLATLPPAPRLSRQRGTLAVYHVPARLRVVVLAPTRKGETVDARSAYAL